MEKSLSSILEKYQCTPDERMALRLEAREEFWRRGDLTFKLHAGQLRAHKEMQALRYTRWVLEIARKWGKTFFLLVIAFCCCLRKSKARVVYGAPTLKYLVEFVLPVIDEICEDAPDDRKPRYNASTGHLLFQNGSYIHFFGADDKAAADRGRGPKADLAIFDEAGFCSVLAYVVKSIFKPQLLLTRGPVILGSTPAEEPEHDFTRIAEMAEANGTYSRQTLHDNPLLTKEQVQTFIEEDAKDEGMTVEEYIASPTFRREYLAERITDSTLAVMGDDWTKMRKQLFVDVPRPKFFDGYTMLDMGGVDPHAVLFGYWHFGLSGFVCEDELLLRNGENTTLLAGGIKEKEVGLWGTKSFNGTLRGISDIEYTDLPPWLKMDLAENAPEQPYFRVCDNDTQVARDLMELHGLAFMPTRKDEKRMQVNAFRVLVRSGKFFVNPRCRNLDRHLVQTTWANAKMLTYKRTNAGEHGDLLDCFVAGTMIRAERGAVPIESLCVGDLVWTRRGLRPVTAATRTKSAAQLWRMETVSGEVLYGTAEHPVLTQFGWRALSTLTAGCTVYEWSQSSSSGAEEGGGETRALPDATTASTTHTASGAGKSTSIGPFMNLCMDLFRRASAFTMWTAIPSTTLPTTSPSFPRATISGTMPASPSGSISRARFSLRPAAQPRRSGTGPGRVAPGTPSIPGRFGEMLRSMIFGATGAARPSNPRRQPRGFAVASATQPSAGLRGSTTSQGHASSAVGNSRETSTTPPTIALGRVRSVAPTGLVASTYNLSVGDVPEYFANGVLVHNCAVYGNRNWNKNRNPTPDNWDKNPDDWFIPESQGEEERALVDAFGDGT